MSEGLELLGTVGTVTPPADMMEAARLSLTPTGFENLMARTGGRIPTPAELVEFADAERAAGIVHAHEARSLDLTPDELASEQADEIQADAEVAERLRSALSGNVAALLDPAAALTRWQELAGESHPAPLTSAD